MDNRSIGVFDSGLGGLTAAKEIMRLFPNESIVYFGDTSRVPYGTRSKETILKYTHSDIRFLLTQGVKMIVIACGTASSAALPHIKGDFSVPIYGVVDAAVYTAVRETENKRIGVIGTSATIKSGAYTRYIKAYDPTIETFEKACPLFVPLVENGHFDTKVTELVIEEYLAEIRAAGVDTLILGCTHYPLLETAIARYMGEGVKLISPGQEVARFLKKKINENNRHSEIKDEHQYRYFVSDSVEHFEELGGIFLEKEIDGQVQRINIESY
ncbi:MAG: glutamate racemase [Clostridia bacterium]|nr:glutamate racemase [Clostridia bacterium]